MGNFEIGSRIKQYRKAKGITQAQLGEMVGRTESSITKYEAGSVDIPLTVIDKIAESLEVPTDLLLYGSGYAHSQGKYKPFLEYLKVINYFVRDDEFECTIMPDKESGKVYRLSLQELEQIEDFINSAIKKAISTFSVNVTDYQDMFSNFEEREV